MDSINSEVLDLTTVTLNNEVTNGLFPDQVLALKERVVEINDELEGIGQGVRAVAANLHEIKQNVKAGNWRAFLNSGAINCSARTAIDLVSAHEKWLGASDVVDHLLAGLSARSLQVMGGNKNNPVTEKQRQKVFEAVGSGEKVTESFVRLLVRGRSKSPSVPPKSKQASTETQKIARMQADCERYKATIQILRTENSKLKKQLAESDKTAKKLDKLFA